MDLKDKTVLAHMGFFDRQCRGKYKENSAEACRASAAKDQVGIIELDLRKSRDGILYCYHGSFLEYFFALKFPKSFSFIKRKYGADALADILECIPESKIVFLDIKDTSISKEDILGAFSGRRFKEVILGNKSPSFLRRFNGMPEGYVKILNGNIFCGFYDLGKLRKENFKYYEAVFPFQVRRRVADRVKRAGMELRCAAGFFRSKDSYWKKINKYGIRQVSSDFI